jgi:hypothetical protein
MIAYLDYNLKTRGYMLLTKANVNALDCEDLVIAVSFGECKAESSSRVLTAAEGGACDRYVKDLIRVRDLMLAPFRCL